MGGGRQRGSRGAVWGNMVVSAQAAYTVGEASDEAEDWALLGPEGDWDGEVGFRVRSVVTGLGSGGGCRSW